MQNVYMNRIHIVSEIYLVRLVVWVSILGKGIKRKMEERLKYESGFFSPCAQAVTLTNSTLYIISVQYPANLGL